MKLYKTYKFKLKPTEAQKETFDSWINTCRYVYNVALEERITAYQMRKKSVSRFDQYNQLPLIKQQFPFVGEVYSDTLGDTLDRVDTSYKNFFSGSGFPKFAKKGFYNSFTFKRNFKINEKTIKLPKIGEVKYFNSRTVIGTPKTATIIKENNNWFICIDAEYESTNSNLNNQEVGIDVGIAHFATLSNGEIIDSPLFLENSLKQLRVLNRKLARQKKDSNSRKKTIFKLQILQKKISNQRNDFLHKESTKIANMFTTCYIEDLKLQKMNTINSTLTRRMNDSGFGIFKQFLQYKFKERGNEVILINPAYTSQTCSECKSVDKKSRLSQSEFVCTSCGHIDNADLNASKNIMREGISQKAKRKILV